jgi:uncharacterized protein YfbU (UPF0304 family)
LGESLAKTRLSFKGFSMTRKRTKLNFVTFGKEKEKEKENKSTSSHPSKHQHKQS